MFKRKGAFGNFGNRKGKFAPSIRRRSTGLSFFLKKKTFSLKKRVQQITEVKTVDTGFVSVTNTVYSNPPVAKPLFLCIAGTGTNNRIGNKVTYKSVRFQGWLETTAANVTQNEDLSRILIVYDSQPNAALPNWTDVIQGFSASGATSSLPMESPNINNTERFKILMDEKFAWPQWSSGGGATLTSVFNLVGDSSQGKIYIDRMLRIKGMPAQFNSTNGGTIADFTKGTVVLFFVSQNAANGTYQLNYQSRVRFFDV